MNKISRRFNKNNNKNAVICLHKLGDTVFTIPTIEKILQKFDKDVQLFCLEHSVPIYRTVFDDRVEYITFREEDFILGGRIASSHARKIFRKQKVSVIIDLTGSPRSASLFIRNSAGFTIGFNQNIFRSLYTVFNYVDSFNHLLEIYPAAVKGLIEIEPEKLPGYFRIKEAINGEIIIHPFAGWSSKEWGLRNFISLADKLNGIHPTRLIAPAGSISVELIKEIEKEDIKFTETTSIEHLIEILRKALILVGNDSGPVYIANLLGIPTFTLFGPSNPALHFIPSEFSGYLNEKLPCSPSAQSKLCFTDGGRNGCPSNECMQRLELNKVYHKILDLIKNRDLIANNAVN